jgi:hypothetical protein
MVFGSIVIYKFAQPDLVMQLADIASIHSAVNSRDDQSRAAAVLR